MYNEFHRASIFVLCGTHMPACSVCYNAVQSYRIGWSTPLVSLDSSNLLPGI